MDLDNQSHQENIRIDCVPKGSKKDSQSMIIFLKSLLRGGLDLDNSR